MKEKNNPVIIHLVNRFIKDELVVEKWRLLLVRKKPKTEESDNHSDVLVRAVKIYFERTGGLRPS